MDDLFGVDWHDPRYQAKHQAKYDDLPEDDKKALYGMFRGFTLDLIAAGRVRGASELVLNRIRWETALRAGKDHFKINQHLRKPLALAFIKEFPRHRNFFEFRIPGDTGLSYDDRTMFGPDKTSKERKCPTSGK